MARLNKYTVKQALNTDAAAMWDISTRLTISAQAHASKELKDTTTHLMIWSDSVCYMRFDRSSSDTISTNNDIKIPSETLLDIRVPRGIQSHSGEDEIYVHFKQVTSAASSYIRLVEV